MTIPNNPSLNEEWTNDVTGVTYKWDGTRWFVVSTTQSELEENFVTKVTFEGDQERQDDSINRLETEVDLLAGVKAVGRWTYRRRIESSPRPPTLRTFYGTHKDDVTTVLTSWEDTNLLMISKTDLDDNTFTFSEFQEGDKVEVIAKDGSSAVYGTVTNNPGIDSYANMVIDVERWRGGPVEEAEYLISAYRPGSSNGNVDLDILDQRYLIKTGDELSGTLKTQLVKSLRNTGYAFEVKPDDNETLAAIRSNGTAFFNNEIVINKSRGDDHTGFTIKGTKQDGTDGNLLQVFHNAGATPDAVNYTGKMDSTNNLVNKGYVDSVVGSGVPVGSIMIWMNTTAPAGWFKLQGSNFDINTYPQLHAYLQNTSGYTSGKLPNWSGYYPGNYGDHLTHSLGSKQGYKTGQPSGGAPKSTSNTIPTGATRTFTATGNTNAYSNGQGRVTVGEGWDSTTRPKTVVVHYIIKHD